MNRISLRSKFIGSFSLLVLLITSALLLFMRLESASRLEMELHKRGLSIARNLADQVVTPILTENTIGVKLLVSDFKSNEDDIRYIYILNHQREVVAHTFGPAFPPDLLKTDQQQPGTRAEALHVIEAEGERILDVAAQIHGGDFGRVHIGISEDLLRDQLRTIMMQGLPFVAIILVVGGAAAWWFASSLTRPIALLADGARRVGDGDLDLVISNGTRDELGELTRAFNTMTRKLRDTLAEEQKQQDELRLQASMLEDEVAERQRIQEELIENQQQLERLNQQLEERISEALKELRFKDKVMIAQGRQAAMGEMINNIAHQWRQPINNVGLLVQNIKADFDAGDLSGEELTQYVDKTMDLIMFMSQTINDFSSFFSPDKMKSSFPASKSIKKVLALTEASLSSRGITVKVDQDGADVLVDGFFNEFNQALLNIINNARDVLVERSVPCPLIRISAGESEGSAVLRVRDNAGGIGDDIISRIFEPYFTTKEAGKGSGVGLYMAKSIIEERMGGSLSVANVDGGADFRISIPLAKDAP